MKTDARIALELLLALGRNIDAQVLADHGGVSVRAARGILTRLARTGVLHATGLGDFVSGPGASAWCAAEPKTRPGGTSRRYLIDRQRRELARQLHPHKASAGMRSRASDGSCGRISTNDDPVLMNGNGEQ